MRLPGEILQGILARAALALLRIYLGAILVISAISALNRGFPATFTGRVQQAAETSNYPLYREFLQTLGLPHPALFAQVVSWGQLVLGLLLMLGFLTRLCATTTLVLALSYMVATQAWPGTAEGEVATMGAISLALIIGGAGRTFGLDSVLARRWPRSMLW